MDAPLDWGKRILASISPRKKTPEASPRTDTPVTTTINPLKKESSPRQESIPHSQDPALQDCVALSHLATEIDILYRSSKEVIAAERVEHAYVKALRCFVQTYEQNPQETKIHLQKLLVLFLELQSERRKDNPRYTIPEAYVVISNQAHQLLKKVIG